MGNMVDGNNVDITHYTIDRNYEIPPGYTLTIRNKQTLKIDDGITLTNEGTIYNGDSGTVGGNGNLVNHGLFKSDNTQIPANLGDDVKYKVDFDVNYTYPISGPPTIKTRYLSIVDPLPTDLFNRKYYTLEGWYNRSEGGQKITHITGPTMLFAY